MEVSVWVASSRVECWDFKERHARRVEALLPDVNLTVCRNEEEFRRSLSGARVAVVWRFEESWLEEASSLEWIVTPAAGRDYFDLSPRAGLDIEYCSFHGEIIAETVLAFLLAHCRGVLETLRLQGSELWPRVELARKMKPLRGSRLTILGLGNIGTWVARLARPFGVEITGVRRHAGSVDALPVDRVIGRDELDEVLPATDFLVVCLPRDPETDHIIDARRLALLPPHAVLINVGRGNAVDEEALAAGLESSSLAAAYLDVYQEEPLPASSPLRRCGNVLLMPHASAIAPNYLDLFVEELVEKFKRRYEAS